MSEQTRKLSRDRQIAGKSVFITSIESTWTAVPNTVVTSAVTTVAVSTYVTATSARRHCEISAGTSAMFRLKYYANVTAVTEPVIRVLGIDKDLNYGWLQNGAASITSELPVDATDVSDGTYKYTTVTKDTIFDLQGYSQFIPFVTTAMAVGSGTAGVELQYKIV